MQKDKNIIASFSSDKEKDLYYEIRKDIKLGKEAMYDFDTSIDELIGMLSKSTL